MPSVHRGRLAFAIAVATAIVVSSPFIPPIVGAISNSFPAQFVSIMATVVGAAVALAVIVAVTRIRERRSWRFAGLIAAVAGAMLYARAVATGNLQTDAVEHAHFVEYGLVALLFYRAWRPLDDGRAWMWPLLAGVFVGIADEFVQWFVPGRVGEAHDIALNAVAVLSGLLFAMSVDSPARFAIALGHRAARPIAYGIGVVIVTFALFVQAVHLGHEIYDPEIGLFWSHYSAADLIAASRARSERWKAQPPVVVHPLSREDHYLSEGLWHVQSRNRAWTADDPFTAWRENRILEKYFEPVLETASFGSLVPPRWPQDQRAQTAARVGTDPGIYISRAAPYPIYTWSPLAFWSAVAVIVAAVISAC